MSKAPLRSNLYGLSSLALWSADKIDTELDGILYSSVQYEKEGMNLALKPDVVKENKIKLIGAFRRTSHRTSMDIYHDSKPIITKCIDYETGRIIWK